ncbi:chromosomal replication initiator protein DnaA [Coraliomargarita akajimensis]|uniref:Chromosomal replication initiator protein DnaA n=1 Tax=Coraliomargarita akajimensis (strain DSM 45221 / IAM 15411 / JCM 23193 / KCTC 12865 / 04OKA010-24) TaxID=583355 RepID=D5EKE9_CORAD|nr:chromosomal replication initiator protein DnaA [Coraliomargarita akajimensis]ADE53030.1 chromosomal replication initiator protein DnaA [Coraliomargarita akajimensis DSM 45221]
MPNSTPTLSLWESVNNELKSLFPADLYDMWFDDLKCVEQSEQKIVLAAPNEFNAIWIENNYLDVIAQQARSFAGAQVEISVLVDEVADEAVTVERTNRLSAKSKQSDRVVPTVAARTEGAKAPQARRTLLNPRNTFENFVVGSGNQLAHAASIAVANAPGRAYNPLFVFGETGLGKTHLMHAVAHQMLVNNPNARIAYVSTEKFTNEFIRAIQENKLAKFRKYYRTVDALLVDDIHFLSGKESTQEEFFHTFNDLFESGRQIFLASDRPANEIERLENRLISRFQWGLVTDMQAPDYETRVAILRKKAIAMDITLDDSIVDFLAERVSRNVRRMEGALTRIASYNSLMNRQLDLDGVERLLSDLFQEEAASKVTVEQIQKKVSEYYQIRYSDLIGRRRTSSIVFPRQVAMYISRTLTSDPLKSIGDAFGGRDHGTVIHACKQVENMMEQDGTVKRAVDYLIKQLSHNRV